MPSAFTHALVGATATQLLPREVSRVRVGVFLAVVSAVPDLDVIAFQLGIPYAHSFGHRGFSHSLLFAVCLGVLTPFVVGRGEIRTRRVAMVAAAIGTVVVASHGLLDAMTDAGLGIGFFIPFSDARYFLPFRPIETASVDPLRFFSVRGLEVLWSEMKWVWAPLLAVSLLHRFWRRHDAK
jgi:inner membrane protein